MSELEYDKNYSAWLTTAGITPPTNPINLKGVVHAILLNLGGGGAVASVSAADGSLTVTPTTGAVTASRAALTGDVTASAGANATTLVATTNVESIIRANTLDQLAPAAANVNLNSFTLSNLKQAINAAQPATVGQLAGTQVPYVVSGCVWTADSPGSSLNCSMTAGTVVIKGILLTAAAVTSRAFVASNETYVDLSDNGDGTAAITYTAVPGYTTAPALAANSLRVAVISAGTSVNAGIAQGASTASASTQPSTTVAVGSNGSAISTSTLNVAASTTFPTGGGYAIVSHASGQTYLIQYTGKGTGTLTGVTVLAGTPANTVSTGDVVSGVLPLGTTDSLGNLVFPSTPYPVLIGQAQMFGAYTTTLTASSPLSAINSTATSPFIIPFIVPPGPARRCKITFSTGAMGSSATAGTALNILVYTGNPQSGGVLRVVTGGQVKVASDADVVTAFGFTNAPLPAGSYNLIAATQQGAAGTLSIGVAGVVGTFMSVELV